MMGDREQVKLKSKPSVDLTEAGKITAGTRIGVRSTQFNWIPAGEFMMGRPDDESGYDDETPVHQVLFKQGFWMGKHAITQKQWMAIMAENPSTFIGKNLPVERVKWDDVQIFLKKLNEQTSKAFRLPSEAEWEYACRAGSTGPFNSSLTAKPLWCKRRPRRKSYMKTVSVYSCKPNSWGLYHMHSNVPEWVQDHWHHDYTNAPSDGSAWLSVESDYRVVRGGDWQHGAEMRSAFRIGCHHDNDRHKRIGFRLVHDSCNT
ncbi:MAG: SUMF1/EgtB/PvdO family nonheme iron enzyme [Mariprofundaceae bacterium]